MVPSQPMSFFFNSEYTHGVDKKRRVQIPAKWRQQRSMQDPDLNMVLILWPKGMMDGVESGNSEDESSEVSSGSPLSDTLPCILGLPPDQWCQLSQKLTEMSFGSKRARTLRRLIGRNSDSIPIDRSGRISIPETMARRAGITDSAVLVGVVDRFEIWNPDQYKKVCEEDDQFTEEAFSMV